MGNFTLLVCEQIIQLSNQWNTKSAWDSCKLTNKSWFTLADGSVVGGCETCSTMLTSDGTACFLYTLVPIHPIYTGSTLHTRMAKALINILLTWRSCESFSTCTMIMITCPTIIASYVCTYLVLTGCATVTYVTLTLAIVVTCTTILAYNIMTHIHVAEIAIDAILTGATWWTWIRGTFLNVGLTASTRESWRAKTCALVACTSIQTIDDVTQLHTTNTTWKIKSNTVRHDTQFLRRLSTYVLTYRNLLSHFVILVYVDLPVYPTGQKHLPKWHVAPFWQISCSHPVRQWYESMPSTQVVPSGQGLGSQSSTFSWQVAPVKPSWHKQLPLIHVPLLSHAM